MNKSLTKEEYRLAIECGVKEYTASVRGVVTPDGKHIIVTGFSDKMILLNLRSGDIVKIFQSEKIIFSFELSTNGKTIIAHSIGCRTEWDISNGDKKETADECIDYLLQPGIKEKHSRNTTIYTLADNRKVFLESRCGTILLKAVDNNAVIGEYTALKDGEWVALTLDGKYRCSPNAKKYISYDIYDKYMQEMEENERRMMRNRNKLDHLEPPSSDWMARLWKWADENFILSKDLPRNEEVLLGLEELCLEQEGDDGYLLKDIAPEIGMLHNLTSLSFTIENVKPYIIPKEIGNLKNLTYLSIASCGSKVVMPQSFTLLNKLETVSFSGAITEDSIVNILQDCTNLLKLYIDNNQIIETLPNEILNCTHLNELILVNNRKLQLSPEQFEWALCLRDDIKGYDRVYYYVDSEEKQKSYTVDYGQKFQYYCIAPY